MKEDNTKSLETMVHGRLITMSQWDGGRRLQKALSGIEKNQEDDRAHLSRTKGT